MVPERQPRQVGQPQRDRARIPPRGRQRQPLRHGNQFDEVRRLRRAVLRPQRRHRAAEEVLAGSGLHNTVLHRGTAGLAREEGRPRGQRNHRRPFLRALLGGGHLGNEARLQRQYERRNGSVHIGPRAHAHRGAAYMVRRQRFRPFQHGQHQITLEVVEEQGGTLLPPRPHSLHGYARVRRRAARPPDKGRI